MLTVLCPACQVKQRRFSGKIHCKLVDWHFRNLSPDYDPDLCNAGFVDKCSCESCEYERRETAYKKLLEKEEEALNIHMRELAVKYYPNGIYNGLR